MAGEEPIDTRIETALNDLEIRVDLVAGAVREMRATAKADAIETVEVDAQVDARFTTLEATVGALVDAVREMTATEKQDSITLKRNAKGEYAWDIKRYYDSETSRRAEKTLADIADIDASLRQGYLYANAGAV